MIVKYNSVNNSEVTYDNIDCIKTICLSEPLNATGYYLEDEWKTYKICVREDDLNVSCDWKKDEKYSQMTSLFFAHGIKDLLESDINQRKLIYIDNLCRGISSLKNSPYPAECKCVSLIKKNEIIIILTNIYTYVMNDEGKTIQIIK